MIGSFSWNIESHRAAIAFEFELAKRDDNRGLLSVWKLKKWNETFLHLELLYCSFIANSKPILNAFVTSRRRSDKRWLILGSWYCRSNKIASHAALFWVITSLAYNNVIRVFHYRNLKISNWKFRPLPLRATGLWGVSRVAIGCKIVYCRESAISKSLIGFSKCTHAPTGSVNSIPLDWQKSTATEIDSAGIPASLNTFSRSSLPSSTLFH